MFNDYTQLSDFINVTEEQRKDLLIKWGYEIKEIVVWQDVGVGPYDDYENSKLEVAYRFNDKEALREIERGERRSCKSELGLERVFEREVVKRFTEFFLNKIA